jgi:phosphoribosylanthranilate isomerase
VRVAVKFCGITRTEDAAVVRACGGSYAGVVMAGGPRSLEEIRARKVLGAVAPGVARVVVVPGPDSQSVADLARRLAVNVVQLHGDPRPADVERLRALWEGEVWSVVRSEDVERRSGDDLQALGDVSHALVVDSGRPGTFGGTGQPFEWRRVAPFLRLSKRTILVLAGGLTAENVGRAIEELSPDIVDVSSGVESAPGVKDHSRMRAFADAAHRISERVIEHDAG